MDNLSVLNGDDGDQPVVVGHVGSQNLAVHFVFENHNAAILMGARKTRVRNTGVLNSWVQHECVAGVKANTLAISGKARDQICASSNNERPTWKLITGLEDCIVGKRVEIMLAIDESAQALHDNFKEWIQGFVSC